MFASLSLAAVVTVFALAAAVVLVAGTAMTGMADRIADRTGLGEALTGGVLLGVATSLSGTVVSLTAALDGNASLAFSNGVGGIAAQTAFLALADIVYRRANLEHAAAELTNMFQAALLILMLAIPLAAFVMPPVTVLAVHPASVLLVAIFCIGVKATGEVRRAPMWNPVDTAETRRDVPEDEDDARRSAGRLLAGFFALMLILGLAGWTIARAAAELTDRLDLSQALVGALMTAVVTSLPELVTTMAAVRRNALQLAVGGIIGGNTFDVLFLTLSDIGYREGSIYHAVGKAELFWLTVGMAMTAILLLGLIMREKRGPGGIGVESLSILAIYCGAVMVQALQG
ncbi:cation transporter [Maritimibacter sp. 55A14]|uniref:sodium:calcium antiporter n=1 Tax=Maritimibacter sp. 55A14 TaxID=2174844 RepID=UPI000D60FE08|nr:cation transporter [Maritimibacter sp. 55A14]PWE33479.1 cation transporter [Maritimibacter sp. 55A14]